MDKGEVGFMNLPALLHFAEQGGVLFATGHKEEAAGFTVESADKGKKFIWVLVAKPVDECESSIGTGGVNEPAGGFVYDQEGRVIEEDGRFHGMDFGEMCDTSKGSRIRIRIKMKMRTSVREAAVPLL